MKTVPWIGLLAAGPLSPSLFRLAHLHAHLGPVCCATNRVGSRLANRLKAGRASASLGTAQLVLVTGPEAAIPELCRRAAEMEIDWTGRTVLLLDTPYDAVQLESLAARGATTGTLDTIAGSAKLQLAADVPDGARRVLQRFARETNCHVLFLEHGRRDAFQYGTHLTNEGILPVLGTAVESLRRAGLSLNDANTVIELGVNEALRSWMKAGWKSAVVPPPGSTANRLEETGRLAASLAHDWNNLLQLASLHASEIQSLLPEGHPAQNTAGELLQLVTQAADAPRRLVRWLREETDVPAPSDLDEVVTSARSLLQMASGSGIPLHLELHGRLPALPLDRPLVVHALLNLVRNAAEAMEGGGAITIRTSVQPGSVILEVADTGRGIAPEHLNRLFDPFFTTKSTSGGSGLGLQTVRSLAAAHDAEVTVSSTPGEGTRFVIAFPVAAQAAKAATR